MVCRGLVATGYWVETRVVMGVGETGYQIGFRSVEEVSPAVATTVKGFDRPLFLYRK